MSTSIETIATTPQVETAYRPRRLDILVVEPSAADYGLIEHALKRMPWYEVQITLAGSVKAAQLALGVMDFDVVLIGAEDADADWTDDALAFARTIATLDGAPPVLLLSVSLDTEIEYDAIGSGIAACLSKDEVTSRVLENSLRLALRLNGSRNGRTSLSIASGSNIVAFAKPLGKARSFANSIV